MIAGNGRVYCDRCKKWITTAWRSEYGATAGFYDTKPGGAWEKFANPGEEDVCDACMWDDPRYIAVYGIVS